MTHDTFIDGRLHPEWLLSLILGVTTLQCGASADQTLVDQAKAELTFGRHRDETSLFFAITFDHSAGGPELMMGSQVRRARCLLMHLETHDMLIDGTTEHKKPKESAMGAINAAGDSFKQLWDDLEPEGTVPHCKLSKVYDPALCRLELVISVAETRLSGASANQTWVEQAKAEVTSGTGVGTKHRRFGHVRVWDLGGRSCSIAGARTRMTPATTQRSLPRYFPWWIAWKI